MDKREVPLLTAVSAMRSVNASGWFSMGHPELKEAVRAIADGDAATYNTHTHEIVPKGMREKVEAVIACLRAEVGLIEKDQFKFVELAHHTSAGTLDDLADDLRHALNGEKANG